MILLDSAITVDAGIAAILAAVFTVSAMALLSGVGYFMRLIGDAQRRQQRHYSEFQRFVGDISARMRALEAQVYRSAEVGLHRVLEDFEHPNPFSAEEIALRDRMRRDPSLDSLSVGEIEQAIRAWDRELDNDELSLEKRASARYIVAVLNGVLARRFEADARAQGDLHEPWLPAPADDRNHAAAEEPPRGRSVLDWLRGRR